MQFEHGSFPWLKVLKKSKKLKKISFIVGVIKKLSISLSIYSNVIMQTTTNMQLYVFKI